MTVCSIAGSAISVAAIDLYMDKIEIKKHEE
jgi:hypothetical protein